jgi:hypothetical protein
MVSGPAGPLTRTAFRRDVAAIAATSLSVLAGCRSGTLPPLMPWPAYARSSHSTPYVISVHGCGGEALYFGSRHTYDPGDPELEDIDRAWQRISPTLVLTEGGDFKASGDAARDVKSAGEAGLLRYLASVRNVRVSTLEPSPAEEVKLLRAKGLADERIKTFYVLRQIAELSDRSDRAANDAYAARMLQVFERSHALRGSPKTLEELDRAAHAFLPALADWRHIEKEYFDPFPDTVRGYTNDVSRELSSFRDLAMIDAIASALASGNRILAVAGASHVVRQERRLRATVRRRCSR